MTARSSYWQRGGGGHYFHLTDERAVGLAAGDGWPAGAQYCFGDGSGTTCPCGNSSAASANVGCLNSFGIGGKLVATGNASLASDTVVLWGTQMPNAATLFFQGTAQAASGAGTVFGDGLRCASGSIVRLGTKTNSSGASRYPATGDASISSKGLVGSAGTRNYQVWYRNAAAYCQPETFNLTNGVRVDWQS